MHWPNLGMLALRATSAVVIVSTIGVAATVDVNRTFTLLREGEQLSAADAAEFENKVIKRPNDFEDRLRLLSYYAGQQGSNDASVVEAARARHILWIIQNEPKAAVFSVATRVFAIQLTGGPFADAAEFQRAKEAWQSQISHHPNDNEIKRNAATFLEVQDPNLAEELLKSTGDDRWVGQVYAKAILGIVASDYRTSDPVLTGNERRSSDFARHALAELESSNNAQMLGGAGFTLCRDGGLLYADGKLDWDYVPLATKLLAKAEQIDPSNKDAFSVVPQLPKHGERPPATVRLGGAQLTKNLKKRIDPVRPPGAPETSEPVRLNVLVGLDGSVMRAVAVGGPTQLREAAITAVKQWIFTQISMNGNQVYVLSTIDLLF